MRPILGGELLGRGGVAGRRPEDRDVAQDDAGEVQLGRLGRGERGDEVDPVTVLERPDEQLVLVARDRDGALDALQLVGPSLCFPVLFAGKRDPSLPLISIVYWPTHNIV